MENFRVVQVVGRTTKDHLGRDVKSHWVFKPPVIFCKTVNGVYPLISRGKSISWWVETPIFLTLPKCTMLHYASSATWHTLVTLEITYHSLVEEAEPMQSSVLHGVFYVYLPLHGAPQIGLFITCHLSLGCEILGED